MDKSVESAEIRNGRLFKRILIYGGFLILFAALYLLAAWRLQSLAVKAAGGFILADLALAVCLAFAYLLAPDGRQIENRAHKFYRAELLAVFVGSLILVGYGVRVALDIPGAFREPVDINHDAVLLLSGGFLLIALGSAWMLRRIAPAMGIVFRAAAAALMALSGAVQYKSAWKGWDPLTASFMLILFLLTVWGFFNAAAEMLRRGLPSGLSIREIAKYLESGESVKSVSDASVFFDGDDLCFTARIQAEPGREAGLADAVRHALNEHYGIAKAVLEIHTPPQKIKYNGEY